MIFFRNNFPVIAPTNAANNDKVNEIVNASYNDDDDEMCRDYTIDEVRKTINECNNNKAEGLDNIGYRIFKIMILNNEIAMIITDMINTFNTIGMYPSALHVSRLYMLKKTKTVSTFKKLRSINICMNLKNIINKLRLKRVEMCYTHDIHGNQCAYTKGVGCEQVIAATQVVVGQTVAEHDGVEMSFSDLDKCFDRFSRPIMCINAHEGGIKGKQMRMNGRRMWKRIHSFSAAGDKIVCENDSLEESSCFEFSRT